MQEYFRSRCLRQEWHPDPLEQPRLLLFAGRNSIPRVCRPSDVSEAYFITPGLLNSRIVLDSYVTFALFFRKNHRATYMQVLSNSGTPVENSSPFYLVLINN